MSRLVQSSSKKKKTKGPSTKKKKDTTEAKMLEDPAYTEEMGSIKSKKLARKMQLENQLIVEGKYDILSSKCNVVRRAYSSSTFSLLLQELNTLKQLFFLLFGQ